MWHEKRNELSTQPWSTGFSELGEEVEFMRNWERWLERSTEKRAHGLSRSQGNKSLEDFWGEGFKMHNFTVGGPCELVRRG